jgi:predicted RND superfamily exporter protein/outer membrane lipoprotein-sorting protein
MTKLTEFVLRRRLWIIALTLLITGFFALQVKNLRIIIDPNSALPQEHPYVSATRLAEKVFGSNYVLVIGVAPKSGDIYQGAVLDAVKRISDGLPAISGVKKDTLLSLSASRVKAISGSADMLEATAMMAQIPQQEAELKALQAALRKNPIYLDTLAGKDGGATAITVSVDMGPYGFRQTLEEVYALADTVRSDAVQVSVSGLPMYLAQLEIYSQRMVFLFPLALLIVGLLHFEAFRTWQGFILPLVTALLSVVWGLGMIGLAKFPMDAFNAVTPILILAVTAGHAVQLLKRYYEEYEHLVQAGHAPEEANTLAVVASLKNVGPVMLMAGLVAVAGFFSLVTFKIETIRAFGVFTGMGILSGLLIELTFIPAVRSMLRPPKVHGTAAPKPGIWKKLTGQIANIVTGPRRKLVYITIVGFALLAATGMTRVSLNNSTKSYFSQDRWFQQDDRFINEHLGGTNTLTIVFDGGSDDAVKNPEFLRFVDGVGEFLQQDAGVGKTTSLADLVKRMNRALHNEDPKFDAIPASRDLIAQTLLIYSMSGEPNDFDRYVDYGYRQALLTAYLKSDSSDEVNALIARQNDYIAKSQPPGVKSMIGGSVPQTAALSKVLVDSKLNNIAQIGLVVWLVSSLVFRSMVAGFLVLAPLVVTVVINFGFMGLTGMPLNTPNAISSAMAIGIGADYAIYLLYRMREELPRHDSLPQAIRATLGSAGQAVLYVGSAIAGGYAVLLFSYGFLIHIWFGALIVLSMVVSVFAALFIVPSLLMTLQPAFLGRPNAGQGGRAAVPAALAVMAVALGLLCPQPGQAAELSANAVMERNYVVSRFNDSLADATMQLISANGEKRVRGMFSVTKLTSNGTDNKRVTRFRSPADIRNTVTLMLEHAGTDDETWLYLPALGKVRRLSASAKKDSFVGSDLSYGDVITYRVQEWTHALLRTETVDDEECYVVESRPANATIQAQTGYARRINWVSRKSFVALRSEFYDVGDKLLKTGRNSRLKLIDAANGRWQPMYISMENVATGHKTVIEFENFKANQNISEDYFTTRYMERAE